MPELPEVEALVAFLRDTAVGRDIRKVELHAISALKTFDPPLDALVDRTLDSCTRRGKFLIFGTRAGDEGDGTVFLAIHLARSGWIRWRPAIVTTSKPAGPKKGPLALRVVLDDSSGFEATEAATEKRLAVYVTRDLQAVEGIAKLGPDPLEPGFDEAAFGALVGGQRGQVKHVLTDQAVIAGVGNAYSDEALHVAKLSPFRQANKLGPSELTRLYVALRSVLTDAMERSDGLAAGELKKEKKSGMRVHGRTGQPCPECGDTVREVSFSTSSLQYCPTCQTGGKPLADRRLSKLLK